MKSVILSIFLVLTIGLSAQSAALDFNRDDRPLDETASGPVASYADVLERATPSVVAVYTARYVTINHPSAPRGMEELFRQFGFPVPQRGKPSPGGSTEERRERLGVGSGVIVSDNGYVVTNHHVITDDRGVPVDEIRVRLSDDREFEATLVGSDEKTDVALLKIDAEERLPAVTIGNSDRIRVGDIVFAIGNPLEVGLTATQGIVSAFGRTSLRILGDGAYENFIQTDAAINLGNSGGALIDARGRLIGINTAIVSRSGGSIGIGFAIPVDMVLNVITNLVERGEVPRGLLGLYPRDLSQELSEAFGLSSTRGALVDMVQEDSPAERAGIQHGDIITRIGDVDIESAPQLRLVVSQMLPGTEVDVHLIRSGEAAVVAVVLGSLNGGVASAGPSDEVLPGVRFEPLEEGLRRDFSVPADLGGVLVAAVEADSPYARTLAAGMVVMEVNGEAVASSEEVKDALAPGVNRLYVWVAGKRGYVVVRMEENEK